MRGPHSGLPFEDLSAFAMRLEEALGKINKKLISAAGIADGEVVRAMTDAASLLLRLDDFGRRRLAQAVEESRVKSLAGDGLVLAAVLTSAVALTQFKRAPRPISGLLGRTPRVVKLLRGLSGAPPMIPAFAVALLYTLAGKRALEKLKARRGKPTTLDV